MDLELNNWEKEKIIHKNKILNFEFLNKNNFITEIKDLYFYLSVEYEKVEEYFYKEKCDEIINRLNIKDPNMEIKEFIAKLNLYNELKDIAQAMMGKIADFKGSTLKEMHELFSVNDLE
ncbi:hypothetical protein CWI39_0300p0020 [Hamiltosporidium magnivora]|uniref:Swi5-like protein n=1 Tax=Hamiltosporidium magnivora TaxID=148818 RepID=A0A4Q9LJU8_9MICR|nr:hypothetical protein CWI39_0300p0020 [Hamiltosporidium magnivora]